MSSTLALVKKEQPKKAEESENEYKDRMVEEAYWKLRNKKQRTKKEAEEFKELQPKFIACWIVKKNGMAPTFADDDLRIAAMRLHEELLTEHGSITPLKNVLLDRLVAAWSMAASYERLFQITKYKIDTSGDDTKLSYTHNENSRKLMQETRKGIETANDQIIRLSQALRNLSSPSIQVKAKNAIVAQNMQINQASPPINPQPKAS
jgi:hypothetical protein